MKLIIIISLILILSCNGASAWYNGFDCRIPITIDNAGNPALEDYQFNVSFSPGINGTSIRVINDTDYTIVPHWCENETGGLCYELWFNVSVGSEVNTDYYIYYGNDSIPSTSDYDSTFTKKYNDSGLVLELHIDEGTGNSVTVDSSGEGNDGTLTNMNITGNATSGWQGVDGGQWDNRNDMVFSAGDHLWFDGADDYVNCENAASLDITDSITLAAWVYKNTTSWATITTSGTGTSGYLLGSITSNRLQFFLKSGTGGANGEIKSVVDGGIPKNQWTYVVGTYDGVVMRTYLNGAFQEDLNWVDTIDTPGLGVYVGATSSPSSFFNGSIDEVRIYNRSLSEDEIYRQYIRSKYAVNTPLISIGYTEEIPHPFLSGAYLFYGEMTEGLTGFRDGMGKYLIWGVVFFAVSFAFALIAKIKTTLIGGK